jgi:hypothetical protein
LNAHQAGRLLNRKRASLQIRFAVSRFEIKNRTGKIEFDTSRAVRQFLSSVNRKISLAVVKQNPSAV